MNTSILPLILGGIIPAILYGLIGIFQKKSTTSGIGLGPFLILSGLSVVVVGSIIYLANPEQRAVSLRSGSFAGLAGMCWGGGITLVTVVLMKYSVPIAKLVPLYNLNTLVAVVLGLLVFAEWKEVAMSKLLVGTVLAVVGGLMVARA